MNNILKKPKIFDWKATPAKMYLEQKDININIELEELLILASLIERAMLQEKHNMTKIFKRAKNSPQGDPLFNTSGTFEQYLDLYLSGSIRSEYKLIENEVEVYLYATRDSHLTKKDQPLHYTQGNIKHYTSLFAQLTVFLQINRSMYLDEIKTLNLLEPIFNGMEEALMLLDQNHINQSIDWITNCVKQSTITDDRIDIIIKDPKEQFGKTATQESKYKGLN
jgi:hypothetical protein